MTPSSTLSSSSPFIFWGCPLRAAPLRDGSMFCEPVAPAPLTAAERAVYVAGHHLGRQQGAEGQVPAQAGVRGARGRLLSDGASQVSPTPLAASLPVRFLLSSSPSFSSLVTLTDKNRPVSSCSVTVLCFATLLIGFPRGSVLTKEPTCQCGSPKFNP